MSLRRRVTLGGLLIVLVGASAAAIGWAQAENDSKAPDQLLPANTLVYARWTGIESQRAAYENTALHDVLEETSLGKFIAHVGQQIAGVAGDKVPQTAWELLDQVWRYGAVASLSFEVGEQPSPRLVVVFPDGATADRFEKLNQALRDLAATAGKVEEVKQEDRLLWTISGADSTKVSWWVEGKHVVLTIAQADPQPVIEIASGSRLDLTSAATYLAHHQAGEQQPILQIWADIEQLISLMVSSTPGQAESLQQWGLDGLEGIAYSVAFEGRALRTELRIDAPAPRRGIVKLLLDQPKVTVSDLPALPENLDGFCLFGFDWARTFDRGLALLKSIPDGPSEEAIQQGMGLVNQVLGVRLREDLLAALGNKIVIFSTSVPGLPGIGTALAIEIKDPDVARDQLERLTMMIEQATGGQLRVNARKIGDVELRTFQLPAKAAMPYSPTVAVTDRWLAVGFLPQSVQKFVRCQSGQEPPWKPDDAFAQTRGDIPTEGNWIGWNDPRPRVQMLLGVAPIIAQVISNNLPVELDPTLLPAADEVNRYLFSGHTAAVLDQRGMRWIGNSAIPMVTTGSPDSMTVVAAVGAAAIVPAMQQARVKALTAQPSFGAPSTEAQSSPKTNR